MFIKTYRKILKIEITNIIYKCIIVTCCIYSKTLFAITHVTYPSDSLKNTAGEFYSQLITNY